MSFQSDLAAAVAAAFDAAPDVRPLRPSLLQGFDYQSETAFRAARGAGMSPLEAAGAAAARLKGHPAVSDAAVSGKGFLNVRIGGEALAGALAAMAADPGLGVPDAGGGRTAILDFGGPNICKRLHAGHLRSFVIGESLRRILAACGWRTVSDIHLGDWGLPVGMALLAADGLGGRDPAFLGAREIEALYVEGAAAAAASGEAMAAAKAKVAALQAGDPGLLRTWKAFRAASLGGFLETAGGLGACFDLVMGESDVAGLLPGMFRDLESRGLAERDGDSLLCRGVPEGCPPLVLSKSDGAATYAATDLATILARRDSHAPSLSVYCVDRRQSLHFEAVFHVAREAGYCGTGQLVHAGFGTVNGGDGKPLKTREGSAPRLSDLIASAEAAAMARSDGDAGLARLTALAAIKYADLSGDRLTGYAFDAERITASEGRTGPYLQYADVRLRAIMRKAAEAGVKAEWRAPDEAERALAVECLGWPEAVALAARNLQPGVLAEKGFLVAQAFSRFYVSAPVVTGGAAAPGRLALCGLAQAMLARTLDLLGIDRADRM